MLKQKIHFHVLNSPSKQTTPNSKIVKSKKLGFYLPQTDLQKNQEKFTFQPKKKAFSKRLEEVSQNHSKYLFTNSDERGSNESFNENEKDLLQTINYKTILDHSKNDKDEFLNFTYFSKEIGLSDEKNPKKYLFLIRSKSKQKKLNNLTFSNNKSNCKYISNVTKKLPDISKDSIDRIEDVSIFQNKERKNNSNFYLSKISHKKNNAIDYKNNNISSNKKEEEQNIPINSTENFEKPQTTGQINEKIIKSKLFDEKKLIFKANWSDIKKPLSPKSVLRDFSQLLSIFEKSEILNFKEIYYLSTSSTNKTIGIFEDKKGYYNGSAGDQINYRYEIKEELGKGTFGKVFRVYDHKKKQDFALKIMKKEKVYYNQAINEINVLSFIKHKDIHNSSNIVKILNYFLFRNRVCIVFELMSLSLYSFLKLHGFQGLSLDLIRKIAIQLLQTLSFLYKYKIIHCDFKPENILLKNINKSGVKLIDLGSSCFLNSRCFSYIQSRYYRSPEILFGFEYGMEIDMWSMGCVLAELYLGTPVFPGDSEIDMVLRICEVLGIPDKEFIKGSKKKDKYFDIQIDGTFILKNNIKDIQKKRNPKSIALKELIESDNDDFLDLIAKCLTFDPKKRIKPHLALLHPWIINELPIEIKHLYLKECQELTHEIEKYEKNSLEKVILIDEGFKLKQVKSLKSNSLEKKIKNKENSRNKEKLLKKSNQYYGLSTEKNEIKGNMKNIELFSNFINLKDTRKNKNFSKKKSITFHGVQEY